MPFLSLDRTGIALVGLTVATAIFLAFLFGTWPREIVALTGAGVLMLSPRHMLGLVAVVADAGVDLTRLT